MIDIALSSVTWVKTALKRMSLIAWMTTISSSKPEPVMTAIDLLSIGFLVSFAGAWGAAIVLIRRM
jgi:hypothetical protein